MRWLLVTLLLGATAFAATKHAPLPDKLLNAKTVYIDNRSGYADVTDRAYQEISKLHRFSAVSSRKDADVLLIFTAQEFAGGSVTSGTVDDSGNVDMRSRTVNTGKTVLTVADPSSGEILWSDTKSWGGSAKWAFVPGGVFVPHSATKDLIRDLLKRLSEH